MSILKCFLGRHVWHEERQAVWEMLAEPLVTVAYWDVETRDGVTYLRLLPEPRVETLQPAPMRIKLDGDRCTRCGVWRDPGAPAESDAFFLQMRREGRSEVRRVEP
jgi:hypothetical protein